MADIITETLTAEVQQIVTAVELRTGLRSRWNGEAAVIDSVSALMLSRTPFLAKKEWSCRITVLDQIVGSELRWRSLLHEVLHSISAGNREADYSTFIGWEEGVVESLQRLYRPELLKEIGVDVAEAVFAETEQNWVYEPFITALRRLNAELPNVSEQEFMETLLRTPLAQRSAEVLTWGKRDAADPAAFVRVFAQVSGQLRRR